MYLLFSLVSSMFVYYRDALCHFLFVVALPVFPDHVLVMCSLVVVFNACFAAR